MADAQDTFSLAKALRDTGFAASVTTTFNAYLPFYEEVVLRRLVASGCSNNVVLMDARQCAEALAHESTRPRRAGIDYTLVPVRDPGAFHPKILLRLGKRKGSLFVGSHNLTVAGFGMNDELTNRFEYDAKGSKDDVGAFASVVELLRDFVSASPTEVAASVDAAIESAPWLAKLHPVSEDVAVLGTRTTTSALWDQLRPRLPENVQRVLVLAPFFDAEFDFLERMRADLGAVEVVVAVDPDTVQANPAKVSGLSGIRFVDARHLIPGKGRREGITPYLHAKALVCEATAGNVLVTGSANASGAAFLVPNRRRNSECIVVRSLDSKAALLDELGLTALFDAPEVSATAWDEVSTRLKTESEQEEGRTADGVATLAIYEGGVCRVHGLDTTCIVGVRAVDTGGDDVGSATVTEPGPPLIVSAPEETFESSAFLVLNDGSKNHWAIIHRAATISEHYASDTRRALRQAIGSLDEDPAQLEVLLRLSEKVIFDDDAVIEKSDAELLRRSGQKEDRDTEPDQVESLAIDATGRRSSRKRRSIASGDITVILDALIHRLGTGGAESTGASTRTGNEEEQIGADDDTDELPPEQPDFERLGAACRRKTRTLLKRMTKQLEAARESGAARRAVIQVAAVLGILRALRVIELRDEWRRSRQRLLHEDALQQFFWDACPLLAVGESSAVPKLVADLNGELCEELSMVLGLMTWLAWECEVDIAVARAKNGWAGVEDERWSWLQCLAYLAPHCAADEHALELAVASVQATPRRGQDGDGWLTRHRSFMAEVASVVSDPEACARVTRPPCPGDIVCLAPQFEPRVRLVVNVQAGSQGDMVTVVDANTKDGEKKFLANRVDVLAVPAEAAVHAG